MSSIDLYNQFSEVAMLDKKTAPWRRRKIDKMDLAYFEFSDDCESSPFWYSGFAGVQFLGLIRWDNWHYEKYGQRRVKEVVAVSMVKKVYMNYGRSIASEHLIFL
jgi:hypothetical protein